MTEFPGWNAAPDNVRHWLCQTLQNLSDNGYEECQEFLRKRDGDLEVPSGPSTSFLAAGQKSVEFYPACKPQSLLEVAMLVLFSVSLAICFLVVYFVFRWYRCNVIHRPSSTWALSSSRLPPIVYSSSLRTEIHPPTVISDSLSGFSDGFPTVGCDHTTVTGNGDTVAYPLLRHDLPPSYIQVMQSTDPSFDKPE